jgi:ubiquinone/menaquinone biosynthesis C-methylase UbiE
MSDGFDQRLRRVRRYWDENTPLYEQCWPTHTLQTALLRGPEGSGGALASNLFLASAAGVYDGCRVLDAGCGVCGPAVDMATAYERISIEAVTLSSVQADAARARVKAAGVDHTVHVHVCDFHRLPFADGCFDVVLFLESAGYSDDRAALFSEAHRLLRRGGRLYVKDVFCREGELSERQRKELTTFNRIWVYNTARICDVVSSIEASGLEVIEARDLTDLVTSHQVTEACTAYVDGVPCKSRFHDRHPSGYEDLPICIGHVRALRP